jgi:hypothetical protein
MPYIETLKVLQTGNTYTGIFEAMALLLNLNKLLHKVSFVRDQSGSRLSVGDSLDVTSATAGRPRKKRWWEQKKATGQLRLPFSLYEPAKILIASYDNSRRQMRLKLRFMNVDGVEKTVNLYHDGHDNIAGNGVKAIRVHAVIKKWVEPTREEDAPDACPFLGTPSPFQTPTQTPNSEQQSNLSQRDCEDLAERAMEHGIAVTESNKVYDDVTGEYVGSEFQALPMTAGAAEGRLDPFRYISFRGLDGRVIRHRIKQSRIRFVDDRAPSGTECRNMLEVAMRNGMVVTPSGKVYDAEGGTFLGDQLNITTDPSPPAFDGRYRGHPEMASVRGDMVMSNGEQWGFQTDASKVTYIGRETYTTPAQGEREGRQRNYEFASLYGNAPAHGNMSNDWVNSPGAAFRETGEGRGGE